MSAPQQTIDRGQSAISSRITMGASHYDIYYRVSQGPLSTGAEAFLAASLLPAMRAGARLRLEGAVSPLLLCNLPQFQSIIHTWYKDLNEIPVEIPVDVARSAPALEPEPSGVACFFSGGVDSFYSVYKHLDEITHLIFVHGFDIVLGDTSRRAEIGTALRRAAAEVGKPLIEVETNMRSLLDPYCDWDLQAHGTALAGVALAQSQFKKVYIASAYAYDRLVPGGSHPLIDPLWSTERTQIVHDGGEATRWEKLESVMDKEPVRRWLRVCWQNVEGAYNCGRCRKCMLVMTFIRSAGLEGKFRTFPPLADLDELVMVTQPDPDKRIYVGQLLQYVVDHHADPEILAAVRAAVQAPASVTASQEVEVEKLRRRVARLEADVAEVTSSRSWRLTAPLRQAAGGARRLGSAMSARGKQRRLNP